ncbi:MAG: GAF domain-containing protein [Anaerolineales bacterium]|nr:GAF domain-containing protein [Anaerolineales bacterium]
MTTHPAPITPDSKKSRFKGSLTGTLVRTLLVFTFIPLALMAGTAYFRSRTLLRDQAIAQSGSLLTNQIELVNQGIKAREDTLKKQFEAEGASVLVEMALHANPQSDQFQDIRNNFIKTLLEKDASGNPIAFNEFLLLDNKGVVKVASNDAWQGLVIDPDLLDIEESQSLALYGLSPIYENELILTTAVNYKTERGSILGTLIGITEGENLHQLLRPLNGLESYADIYFILADEQFLASDTNEIYQPIEFEDNSKSRLASELSRLMTQRVESPVALDINLPNKGQALAQLQFFPGMQSGVVLAIDSSAVYGQINSLVPFTIFLVLGTLVAIGLVLLLGTRRVIRPLKSLSAITTKFAEGDWNQRANVQSNDEIGLLANSFNQMADQLGEIYHSLENKVDERARQIRTAAEVAQSITTIPDLDAMLNKTVELLVQQFDFYQASIFMVDKGGKFVDFKSGYGSATKGLTEKKYRLEVGSASIIGWVVANNKPRIASDVSEDPLHLANELLPETRSEACVPISLGNLVLGVLDIQSTQPGAFSPDAIVMLQTLASQIAAAIQTTGLLETTHINFQELERLFRSSRMIAEANTEDEVLRVSSQILGIAPYPVILFHVQNNQLKIFSGADTTRSSFDFNIMKKQFSMDVEELNVYLSRGSTTASVLDAALPKALKNVLHDLEMTNAAFLPVKGRNQIDAIIMIGSRQQTLSSATLQPYENLADLISIALQKASAIAQTDKHVREVEALASINELTSSTSDIQGFFRALLAKIQQIIGDYNLIVALYDERTNTISIPFSYENGQILSINPFPLGEGLTSILIRTRQPLMLVKDTERKAAELGAKVAGKPAKSWMGTPMMVQGNPIGALIIQDTDHEGAFDEDDLKFFITVANQVAGVINSVHLLDESNQKAVQVEAAAEIARDISGSLDLDELLYKAVTLIRERFNFYHAAIFLLDLPGEFAMIREATGEAGAQLKRQGHKIGVGSKSIVGFVSGRGESLVVDDTNKDATYYANPLLPDTRAEAAIPLRVGERILGVLDVQSTIPYVFSEDNLRGLQILADQLAVAVANTELFAETQEHLSQHRLLHHITSTAASGTTLEEALESAVNGLQVTLGGDRVIILLADRERKILEVKASVGYAEDITGMRVEAGKGVTGWVASHRRPLRVRDVSEDPRYIMVSANTRSELAVPLIYRNELLGVINVESEQVDAYTENDEEMLGTLGGSLAAIIANARLLEQIRAQSERERLVYEITGKIRRSTDIQSILMTTASEISRVTGARYTKVQVNPVNKPESGEKQS